MPDPIFTVQQTDLMIGKMGVVEASVYLEGLTDVGTKKTYRNRVIASYLTAADARYLSFLRSMSRQVKGANFGLDVAAIGLSSISAIAKGVANELATGSAIAAGTRGSLNKEVYFDRTLPAILSAMEARRLEVRGQIERRMKEDAIDSYTLEQGFADVMRYQMATTLDGAIQEITAAAGEKEDEAQESYRNATDSCSPPKEIRARWGAVNKRAYDLAEAGKLTELQAIALAVGAEKKDDATEQASAITIAATRACTIAEADAFLSKMPAQ